MGKIKFYLKNPDSKTESLIFLVYRNGNQYFKYYTGEYVLLESWNSKKQRPEISRKYPENTDIDRQLSKYEFFLKDLINEFTRKKIEITSDLLKLHLDKEFKNIDPEKISAKKKPTLLQYIETYIQDCKDGKRLTPLGHRYQVVTIKVFRSLYNYLTKYIDTKKKKLDFDDITIDFYDDFMKYFHDHNYATNTIGNQIKNLKVIMRAAMDEGIHNNNEFMRKKFKKVSEESDNIYLTEEEINRIYSLDLTKNSRLEKVRDLFIVAARTALRFSDLVNLKESNFIQNEKGSFLKVNTKKTQEEVIVPLKREVVEIFNKYKGQLPRSISNQKMNDYLKEIGQLANIRSIENTVTTKGGMRVEESFEKWELITTHTARRSAATNLFLAGFYPLSIMKITGHKTEKSFLKYIKMTKEDNAYKMSESDYFKNDFKSQVKLRIVG